MRVMLDHLSVIHQSLSPTLAAESGFLVATERRRRIELVERIRPDDARLEQRTHLENPRALVRPDPRRQTVHRVVRLLDGLLESAERQHAQPRTDVPLRAQAMAMLPF